MAVKQNINESDHFLSRVSFPHWQSLGVGVFFDVTQGTERGEMGGIWEGRGEMGGVGGRGRGCAVCIGKHWAGGSSRVLGEENFQSLSALLNMGEAVGSYREEN